MADYESGRVMNGGSGREISIYGYFSSFCLENKAEEPVCSRVKRVVATGVTWGGRR
ncbi:hypothetical protein QUB80_00400 [Chlorogloeopsis sp. ULAP01]|uniref:hypothetical protein n=1 Tax=Chlorogloeopsis sp. ULAP01 TaxID=3056483 RepID=UPI0025AB3E54|nr:hypothetical protein [Chlorogloeopsis sp. ULAP01]MDM9379168.1 hypothetical protein [Chlorogloeopsis sp. ULAP01]